MREGPLEFYNSHCGRYHSTLDYILLPNCLLDKILLAKIFEFHVHNTSDHLPILMKVSLPRMVISHGRQRLIFPGHAKNYLVKIF